MRIGVLASGAGTILQALIEEKLPIAVVLVDRRCRAASVAADAGIAVEEVLRTSYDASFDRAGYTDRVLAALGPYELDLVAMSGFGTILSAAMHAAYPGRILNTHPALLPAFKGWHPVRDALASGVKVTGCTVHLATAAVDDGPILAQAAVAVLPDDDEERLAERIKAVERQLYPATVRRVIACLEQGGEFS